METKLFFLDPDSIFLSALDPDPTWLFHSFTMPTILIAFHGFLMHTGTFQRECKS
jgi:hypothetical protein